ncbi:hypothetical protein [Plantactinospora endophytica]|uniref:Carboxypeptidase regulatory-like domain-containing protein n=1 Tax=Plantactinospora endophytica TaxID=673535 RepID=A0ABQ4E077_9ACTN|nr:hypothetical protein [Plantactinospora endophytica]GIG88108.1 hypothetical protein Pen02_30440 [Plantactinospora endophytica]
MSTADGPDWTDAELLAGLRALFAPADSVPDAVVDAARRSLDWRTLDAELATLAEEVAPALAGVRGDGDRLLTFDVEDWSVEVEVAQAGEARRLVGQVVPPVAAEIDVEQPDGTVRIRADALGRFAVADLPPGATRLVCRIPGIGDVEDRIIRTEWMVL